MATRTHVLAQGVDDKQHRNPIIPGQTKTLSSVFLIKARETFLNLGNLRQVESTFYIHYFLVKGIREKE